MMVKQLRKTHTIIGGLFAALLLIRTGEYLGDYVIGNQDGKISMPPIAVGLSVLYGLLIAVLIFLTIRLTRSLYAESVLRTEKDKRNVRFAAMTAACILALLFILRLDDALLLGLSLCLLPLCLVWRWARYVIPPAAMIIIPHLGLEISLKHLVIFGAVLFGNWLFYPNIGQVKQEIPAGPNQQGILSKRRTFSVLLQETAFPILLSLPFFVWLFREYINLDFWYDELNSLQNYIFVPLQRTLTYYPSTNNHIFFNFVSNVYIKLTGIQDVYALMNKPAVMRLFVLLSSMITLIYLYATGKKFFNRFIAVLSAVVLVTTVPFYNFAVQVRGYALSMMLLSMLLYYVWSFEQTFTRRHAIAIVGLGTLALYTMPLNLYFLASLGLFYTLKGVYVSAMRSKSPLTSLWKRIFLPVFQRSFWINNRPFVIVALLSMAVLLAILLYVPAISSAMSGATDTQRVLKSYGFFNTYILSTLLPVTLLFFLSGRFLLAATALIGFVGFLLAFTGKKNRQLCSKYCLCLSVLLLPFLFSFIRGDMALTRIFVNLTPAFALCLAGGTFFFLYSFTRLPINRSGKGSLIILCGAALYCYSTFADGLRDRDAFLLKDIMRETREADSLRDFRQGRKAQSISYNFYQAHFHPLRLVRDFRQYDYTETIPVVLGYKHEYDGIALTMYLAKFGISNHRMEAVEQTIFDSHDRIHVLTGYPYRFMKLFSQVHPDVQCTILNEKIGFHNVLLCEKMSE